MDNIEDLKGAGSTITLQFLEYQNSGGNFWGYTMPNTHEVIKNTPSIIKSVKNIANMKNVKNGVDIKVSINFTAGIILKGKDNK